MWDRSIGTVLSEYSVLYVSCEIFCLMIAFTWEHFHGEWPSYYSRYNELNIILSILLPHLPGGQWVEFWQRSERSDKSKYKCSGFEPLGDLTIRRLSGVKTSLRWNGHVVIVMNFPSLVALEIVILYSRLRNLCQNGISITVFSIR